MIKLTPRLKTVADMIEKCECFLDVGTDHAYLPAYIVENGVAKRAIASDINEKPLENALKTVKEEGLSDKIELRLSAGFENIKQNEAQQIAVAGMGGIMIAEMIENTPWLKDFGLRLVLQPMTHFELVRRALNSNGFEIDGELTVAEGERAYLALSAKYSGSISQKPPHWFYFGELLNSRKESDRKIVQRIKKMLFLKSEFTSDEEIKEVLRSVENAEGN